MNLCEEAIVKVMRQEGCIGQENMISPDDLIAKCSQSGFVDIQEVSAAIISLIDMDVVEYEMDDNMQTTQLWLLQ